MRPALSTDKKDTAVAQEVDEKDLSTPQELEDTYKLRGFEEWSNDVVGGTFQPEIGNSRGIIFEFPEQRKKVSTDHVSSFQYDLVCHWCRVKFESDEDLYDHVNLPYPFSCNCGYRYGIRLSLGQHMKEQHADILKLDCYPKCSSN